MDIEELYSRFTECNGLTTDSRHCPEGSMFLALKGETFNGNAFAAQSLAQGCRYAVVDEHSMHHRRIHVSCWWKIVFRRCSSWPIIIVVS